MRSIDCCGCFGACPLPCDVKAEYFAEQTSSKQDQEKPVHDAVNAPSHYALLPGVQVIDVRAAIFSKMPEGLDYEVVDCWSRSWEYLTRMWGKNGLEDAKKARFYLDRMIEKMERTE